MRTIENIKVAEIFNDIQGINNTSYYKDSFSEQVAEDCQREVLKYLPKESLAYKILIDSSKFSTKQMWVISYELMKNNEYKQELADRINESQKVYNVKPIAW